MAFGVLSNVKMSAFSHLHGFLQDVPRDDTSDRISSFFFFFLKIPDASYTYIFTPLSQFVFTGFMHCVCAHTLIVMFMSWTAVKTGYVSNMEAYNLQPSSTWQTPSAINLFKRLLDTQALFSLSSFLLGQFTLHVWQTNIYSTQHCGVYARLWRDHALYTSHILLLLLLFLFICFRSI